MEEKILFVDDDAQILKALRFSLGHRFNLVTAVEGPAGLAILTEKGPFAVVVSDLHMPEMDGVQFLEEVKRVSPDSVRLMLTAKGDLESAIQVVNEVNIYRFLTKPCEPGTLAKCLSDALEQYRLVMSERNLLEKTLRGAVQVMTEILSMADPRSFERATALQITVQSVAKALGVPDPWHLEVAALLTQIGAVTLPVHLVEKVRSGASLGPIEQGLFNRVPEIGRNLLIHIPRLDKVAEVVLYQEKRFDGRGFPADATAGRAIPAGARILKILSDLAQLRAAPMNLENAFHTMRERKGWYDPELLEKISGLLVGFRASATAGARVTLKAKVSDLRPGQLLLSNVETTDGMLLIPAGRDITGAILEKIANFSTLTGIKEPILVETAA